MHKLQYGTGVNKIKYVNIVYSDYGTVSVLERMSFDFFEIKFDWLVLFKKFIIIFYFHYDLVYHTIYFNYKLKISIF
jgi:hypothetical protein